MRSQYPLLLLIGLLLMACRPDSSDDPLSRSTPLPIPDRTSIFTTPGCVAADLENWLETVLPNGQAFRDLSLSAIAMRGEDVSQAISQLGPFQSAITQVEVPECVGHTHSLLLEIIAAINESLTAYYNGTIDQALVIEQVTAQTARYDAELTPQLQTAIEILDKSYQQGN